MSKFRIKLKVQALELEVEGSREDAPLMAHQIGQQFVGLLQPAAQLVAGDDGDVGDAGANGRTFAAPKHEDGGGATPTRASGRRGRRKRSSQSGPTSAAASGGNGGASASEDALMWRHDTEEWGAPQQSWTTALKAIWLLYVAGQNTEVKEQSSRQITSTFNRHFKSAGQILKNNVTRDLSKLKGKRNSVISEDTTGETPIWFLTNAGIEYAKRLVAEAKGGAVVGPPTEEPPTEAQAGQ